MALPLSFVLMTWNRSTALLNNSLYTLSNQTVPPLEIVVVEVSPEDSYHIATQELCAKYPLVKLIEGHWSRFNISRGYNVGIKSASPEAQYIATGLMEVFYGRNLLEALQPRLSPHKAFSAACGVLLKGANTSQGPEYVWENWDFFCAQTRPERNFSPGMLMCVERNWWFDIRGYDEQRRPYSYVDNDILDRAVKTGLLDEVEWHIYGKDSPGWAEVQSLHPWHPQSGLFYSVSGCLPDPVIDANPVRNPDGWGEIEGDEPQRIFR